MKPVNQVRGGRAIGQLLLQDAQAGDGMDAQVQIICERLGVLGTDGRAPAWASLKTNTTPSHTLSPLVNLASFPSLTPAPALAPASAPALAPASAPAPALAPAQPLPLPTIQHAPPHTQHTHTLTHALTHAHTRTLTHIYCLHIRTRHHPRCSLNPSFNPNHIPIPIQI